MIFINRKLIISTIIGVLAAFVICFFLSRCSHDKTSNNTITMAPSQSLTTIQPTVAVTATIQPQPTVVTTATIQPQTTIQPTLTPIITDSPTKAPETKKPEETVDINVMSFNILCQEPSNTRKKGVLKTIDKNAPDLFGVQEATSLWMDALKDKFKDNYKNIGEGRDGGNKGEYSAVFFKKDVFKKVDGGTKWLSDTPDKVSKFSESVYPRIFSYVELKIRKTGKHILFVCTHLDHKGGNAKDSARSKQVRVLIDFLKKYDDMPVIVVGDFNCEAGKYAYWKMESKGYKNAAGIAKEADKQGTYNNYGKDSKTIDFCFVNGKIAQVLKYRVITDKYKDEFISDHYPIMTTIRL